jgi:hypothetical protein
MKSILIDDSDPAAKKYYLVDGAKGYDTSELSKYKVGQTIKELKND